MTWTVVYSLLQNFGFAAAASVALAFIAWPFLGEWLRKRIEAQVEEGVQKRLAIHQLTLDKELGAFQKQLERESDRARALLGKESADYSIYAQRRHDAITRLFEDFLRLEILATSFEDIRAPASSNLEQSRLTEFAFRLELSPEENSCHSKGCSTTENSTRWTIASHER